MVQNLGARYTFCVAGANYELGLFIYLFSRWFDLGCGQSVREEDRL